MSGQVIGLQPVCLISFIAIVTCDIRFQNNGTVLLFRVNVGELIE